MILDYTIRPLSLQDIPTVAHIEQKSRPTPWNTKQFTDELTNDNSRPLVLVDNATDQPIGYLIAWLIAGEIQIQNIVVVSPYRGRGLGRLLLNTALDHGLQAGCTQAILEVRESNQPAINLYHQYQFGIVGRRESYYRDGENALLMTAGPFDTAADLDGYRAFINKQTDYLTNQLQFHIQHLTSSI